MSNTSPDNLREPYYLVHEELLRRNLEKISGVAKKADVEIILAFKAFALWKTFDIFRHYISATTASSPFEAQLAKEKFKSLAHTYSPAYEDRTFHTILECSQSITFNSIHQYEHFYPYIEAWNAEKKNHHISVAMRVNPEHSEIATDIYNPCLRGTRFGIAASALPFPLPTGVTGLHVHCLCENDSFALERMLKAVETKFAKWLPQINTLNLGGGHLITRKDYNTEHLIKVLKSFKKRHPNIHIIMEPGSAFAWQTGELIAHVVDTVEDKGIKTAILNVSFTCHMPDCLEMPYWPDIEGAETLPGATDEEVITAPDVWRLGGNSCLSGDFMGYWRFPGGLHIGDKIVFKDMIHYTTVKTNMFNGIQHPSIRMRCTNGTVKVLRGYKYHDYRNMMD